jgi:hypothetical protein
VNSESILWNKGTATIELKEGIQSMTIFRKRKDLFFSFLLFLVLSLFAGEAFQTPDTNSLSSEIDLADWDLEVPEDVGYLSIGILHKKNGDELVVYDVRAKKPVIEQPPKPQSRIPPISGDAFILDDFHRGIPNRLGGYFSSILRAPSESIVTIDETPDGRRSLCFTYNQMSPGFSGFWIHLFDLKKTPVERIFLDATPFRYITFSIKGQEGEESLVLQVADYSWEKKEDSLKIGDVGQFLPSGKIQKSWQQAWIPLEKIPERITRTELASLVFLAKPGKGKVYIGDVAFTTERDVPLPEPETKKAFRPSSNKAMWVWNTIDLLGDEEEQMRLVDFCGQNGITELFLQLPYQLEAKKEKKEILWDRSLMAELLSRLHDNRIKIHALDGDPRFALRQWHEHVLATIESVIQYNKSAHPEERFDGIRYDNEPYVLPEFSGVQKASIIEQYMELLCLSNEKATAAGLDFGVDIPFWFDQKNEFFEPIAQFRGRPLTQCILDIVDNIGIMDYRTTAYGADGVVAHAMGELEYASIKKKDVFIGLETTVLPDETLLEFWQGRGPSHISLQKREGTKALLQWVPAPKDAGSKGAMILSRQKKTFVSAGKITFAGRSVRELSDVMKSAEIEFQDYPGFYGFAIHDYSGFRALIGLKTSQALFFDRPLSGNIFPWTRRRSFRPFLKFFPR